MNTLIHGRKLKGITLFLTLALSIGICRADYISTALPELLEFSDLIIECKIISISEDEVEVKILEVLKGDKSLKTVWVMKFPDWTCASRWTSYQKGQRELMFLDKNLENDQWFTVGSGNEGEMPIEKGWLYYKHSSIRFDKLKLREGFIYGYKFKLSEVKEAIYEYHEKMKELHELVINKKADEFKTENLFLKRIMDELNKIAYIFFLPPPLEGPMH